MRGDQRRGSRRPASGLWTMAAAAMLGVLPGCLVSSNTRTEYSGQYVSPGTFDQIEEGVTKTDWVLAVIGEPTKKSTLDDGAEIWSWQYSRSKSSGGHVFLLYNGSSSNRSDGGAFVEVRDGVVVQKWRD